jgi:transcriptional regulator with XRE-family HTH domain
MFDSPVGGLLREWRRRRRMSQRDLACGANISVKRLGCWESGRSRPNREMLLHLAACLDIPLRHRNELLGAGGFPAAFQKRSFGEPEMSPIHRSVEVVLGALDPNPAFAMDRHWIMLAANRGVAHLVAGAEPLLLRPPVNVLRLLLHPAGLAARVVNLAQWRTHVITRLRRQIDVAGDLALVDLLEELRDYPSPPGTGAPEPDEESGMIAIPFRLATIDGILSFFNTTTLFDAPVDITVSELAIEAFMPADAGTDAIMRGVSASGETRQSVRLGDALVGS